MADRTEPSVVSAPAIYLSNWKDIVGIWRNTKLAQTEVTYHGPCITELHYLGGSPSLAARNQVVDYSGFFRDEEGPYAYTELRLFEAEGWLENAETMAGTLTTNYLSYAGAVIQPRYRLSRIYALVPNCPFLVVRYDLVNPTPTSLVVSVLEQVHLTPAGTNQQISAWHDAATNALIADMAASGEVAVALGAFQAVDGYQVADDADSTLTSPTVSGWYSFNHDGTLKNNDQVKAADISMAFCKRVLLAAGQRTSLYFYLALAGDVSSVTAAADTARSQPGGYWFDETAASYKNWLSNGDKGRRVASTDAGVNDLYDKSLLVIKNIQNPQLGTVPASTNPFAYRHNWVRDGAITAMALDATGHPGEAEQYWRWMASVQHPDGTWGTIYNPWTGAEESFVEPEYDSVGQFLYGVYRHYLATADAAFLQALWPALRRSADWIVQNVSPITGFSAPDYSIWEETDTCPGSRPCEHNVFTHAWYIAGLYAMQQLAEAQGNTALSDWYAGGVAPILTALQRGPDWNPPGLWNPQGYYNRAITFDTGILGRLDSSSNILLALGVIDPASGRASNHVNTVKTTLVQDRYGISRYKGDQYYYNEPYDPAGDEVEAPEPPWPQMSVWVAVWEILASQQADALRRLQWIVSTSGKGYMPHGEAVSAISHSSVLSSMCEPLTGSAFMLASLMYQQEHDLRIIPPSYHAGAFKAMAITEPLSEGSQWANVPYFVGTWQADPQAMTTIKRVYLCNDQQNLYIRIDNLAGSLPVFEQNPLFAIRVYTQDISQVTQDSLAAGLDKGLLPRPVSFLVERRSNDNLFRHWVIRNGAWSPQSSLSGIAPQWDPATGRIEAAIPLSAVSSTGQPSPGQAYVVLALAGPGPTPDSWDETGKVLIHYRWSMSDEAWIYGNIEQ
ncbi:glycoside hydrolase family 15 protein [Nitrospira sp. Nam74]